MKAARSGTLTQWRKSSYSSDSANCVEFAQLTVAAIGVRDSKDPEGPVVTFEVEGWREFVTAIRGGVLPGRSR